jgi:flagellar basal-body rod protein FlgB
LEAALKYRNEEQGAVDGNTVNMDVERSAFAENSVHYQASLTFINGMLTTMQRAIQNQ